MRIYQCDSCHKIIENPYIVKMKEFYVGIDTEYFTRIKTLGLKSYCRKKGT